MALIQSKAPSLTPPAVTTTQAVGQTTDFGSNSDLASTTGAGAQVSDAWVSHVCTQIPIAMMKDLDAQGRSRLEAGMAGKKYAQDSARAIGNSCIRSGVTSPAQVAYILITAAHESSMGHFMSESGWLSESSANAYAEKKYGSNTAKGKELGNTAAGDGAKYKGRGFVQLTGKENYANASETYGKDLVAHPELVAQDRDLAADIMVQGMRDDSFTPGRGGGLDSYINGDKRDFEGARTIVNGTDKAKQMAAAAEALYQAIKTTPMTATGVLPAPTTTTKAPTTTTPTKESPSWAADPTKTTAPTAKTTAPTGATVSGSPPLKSGSKGAAVTALQQALVANGISCGVDGDFGPKTEAAVRSFQQSRGLGVDGVVGPKTAAALNSRAPASTGTKPTTPTTTAPGTGTTTPTTTAPGTGTTAPGTTAGGKSSYDPKGYLGNSNMSPATRRAASATAEALQGMGYKPYIVAGFRSTQEQNDLYAQGRTKAGNKVTSVKGGGSWHNYGAAVDIAFWNSKNTGPSWEESHPWSKIGPTGLANGFTRWGGDFGDRPHLELHPNWGNSCYNLAETLANEGISSVWDKIGAK